MCWNISTFTVMLLLIVVPGTISQAEQRDSVEPATEIVFPEEFDAAAETIPAPASADSEQIIQDWLASQQSSTTTADPPKYLASAGVILVSLWLMVLIGCFGWWRRNVQRNNQSS